MLLTMMKVQAIRSVLRRHHLVSLRASLWKPASSRCGWDGAAFLSSLAGSSNIQLKSNAIKPVRRAFSADDEGSTSEALSDILSRELVEEEENGSAIMPTSLEELKKQVQEDWRIVEGTVGAGDGATIKLFKKQPAENGAKVSVLFHCQDTVEDEGTDIVGADEEDEEPAVAVRFTVLISKAGKTMVLTCVSQFAEARVESVALTDEDPETVTSSGIDSDLYQGPEFTELAEDLQEAFSSYVQTECGVDTDVAAFISMYSDYTEQKEYVRWLLQVQGMLS